MESTRHALPVTPKQIAYARSLALRNRTLLPWEVQQDRRSLVRLRGGLRLPTSGPLAYLGSELDIGEAA